MARIAHGDCYYCGQLTTNGYCDDCGNVPTELVIFGEQIGAPKGAARGMTDAEVAAAAEYKARMLAQDPTYDPSLDW